LKVYEKTTEEVLFYGWDYIDALPSGDTITSSVWTVDSGITKLSEGVQGLETEIMIGGGTLGEGYKAKNVVTGSPSGTVLARTIQVVIVSDRFN